VHSGHEQNDTVLWRPCTLNMTRMRFYASVLWWVWSLLFLSATSNQDA
jgi:hypothetical protein